MKQLNRQPTNLFCLSGHKVAVNSSSSGSTKLLNVQLLKYIFPDASAVVPMGNKKLNVMLFIVTESDRCNRQLFQLL